MCLVLLSRWLPVGPRSSPLPLPRQDCGTMVIRDHWLLLLGGYNHQSLLLSTSEALHLPTLTWRTPPQLSGRPSSHLPAQVCGLTLTAGVAVGGLVEGVLGRTPAMRAAFLLLGPPEVYGTGRGGQRGLSGVTSEVSSGNSMQDVPEGLPLAVVRTTSLGLPRGTPQQQQQQRVPLTLAEGLGRGLEQIHQEQQQQLGDVQVQMYDDEEVFGLLGHQQQHTNQQQHANQRQQQQHSKHRQQQQRYVQEQISMLQHEGNMQQRQRAELRIVKQILAGGGGGFGRESGVIEANEVARCGEVMAEGQLLRTSSASTSSGRRQQPKPLQTAASLPVDVAEVLGTGDTTLSPESLQTWQAGQSSLAGAGAPVVAASAAVATVSVAPAGAQLPAETSTDPSLRLGPTPAVAADVSHANSVGAEVGAEGLAALLGCEHEAWSLMETARVSGNSAISSCLSHHQLEEELQQQLQQQRSLVRVERSRRMHNITPGPESTNSSSSQLARENSRGDSSQLTSTRRCSSSASPSAAQCHPPAGSLPLPEGVSGAASAVGRDRSSSGGWGGAWGILGMSLDDTGTWSDSSSDSEDGGRSSGMQGGCRVRHWVSSSSQGAFTGGLLQEVMQRAGGRQQGMVAPTAAAGEGAAAAAEDGGDGNIDRDGLCCRCSYGESAAPGAAQPPVDVDTASGGLRLSTQPEGSCAVADGLAVAAASSSNPDLSNSEHHHQQQQQQQPHQQPQRVRWGSGDRQGLQQLPYGLAQALTHASGCAAAVAGLQEQEGSGLGSQGELDISQLLLYQSQDMWPLGGGGPPSLGVSAGEDDGYGVDQERWPPVAAEETVASGLGVEGVRAVQSSAADAGGREFLHERHGGTGPSRAGPGGVMEWEEELYGEALIPDYEEQQQGQLTGPAEAQQIGGAGVRPSNPLAFLAAAAGSASASESSAGSRLVLGGSQCGGDGFLSGSRGGRGCSSGGSVDDRSSDESDYDISTSDDDGDDGDGGSSGVSFRRKGRAGQVHGLRAKILGARGLKGGLREGGGGEGQDQPQAVKVLPLASVSACAVAGGLPGSAAAMKGVGLAGVIDRQAGICAAGSRGAISSLTSHNMLRGAPPVQLINSSSMTGSPLLPQQDHQQQQQQGIGLLGAGVVRPLQLSEALLRQRRGRSRRTSRRLSHLSVTSIPEEAEFDLEQDETEEMGRAVIMPTTPNPKNMLINTGCNGGDVSSNRPRFSLAPRPPLQSSATAGGMAPAEVALSGVNILVDDMRSGSTSSVSCGAGTGREAGVRFRGSRSTGSWASSKAALHPVATTAAAAGGTTSVSRSAQTASGGRSTQALKQGLLAEGKMVVTTRRSDQGSAGGLAEVPMAIKMLLMLALILCLLLVGLSYSG